jgi:hypothetical protein
MIHGNGLGPNCKIIAQEPSNLDALMTIDLRAGICSTTGHEVTLHDGHIFISGNEVVVFGSVYKDIRIIMGDCNDKVFITKTHNDASSIEIIGAGGNDTIELGIEGEALESLVFSNIIIDGGTGTENVLTIHDSGSSTLKPRIEVRPTLIKGILGSTSKTVSYFNMDALNIYLGTASANVTVFSTARDSLFTLVTQGEISLSLCSSNCDLFSHSANN